jgi:hypothetical protein
MRGPRALEAKLGEQEGRGEQGVGWRDRRKREMHGGKNADARDSASGVVLRLLALVVVWMLLLVRMLSLVRMLLMVLCYCCCCC